MDTIYEGREIRMGYSIQAQNTFGTRRVDGDTFTEIKLTAPVDIDPDVKPHEIATVSGEKGRTLDQLINNTSGSIPKFTTQGPFCLYESDVFLQAWFQNVSEDSSPAYTKNFTPLTTHPDFTATDEGFYVTWMKRFPAASTSWAFEGCIVQSFKLYGERDGALMLDASWVAHGAPEYDANPSGTWERGLDGPGGSDAKDSAYGCLFFNDIDTCQISVGDTAAVGLALYSFSIEMAHEVEGVSPDGSGSFENWGIHSREGTIELKALKDTTVENLLENWPVDTSSTFTLRWGSAGANADGELEVIAVFKPTSIKLEEDGLIGAIIQGDIRKAAGAGNYSLQVNMSNSIDRAW